MTLHFLPPDEPKPHRWHANFWSRERDERLELLWNAGLLSASQIARELGEGLSRSAVLARRRRLGLVSRKLEPTPKAAMPTKAAPALRAAPMPFSRMRSPPMPAPQPKPVSEPSRPHLEPIHSRPCSIMDLRAGRCRWPLWADYEHTRRYCGAACWTGGPYCGPHAKLACSSGTPSERRAGYAEKGLA